MFRTPSRAEIAIAHTDPINTTNVIAFGDSPNHSTASGSQAMLGSDCMPTTRLPSVSSTHASVPHATPAIVPTMNASTKPTASRSRLARVESQISPFSMFARSDDHTSCGDGNRYGDQSSSLYSSCHTARIEP